MGDFAQLGPVPTLHRIGDRPTEELERDLLAWSSRSPMALVLPMLHDELDRPALRRIVDELAAARYLTEVVIGLDGADRRRYEATVDLFAPLPIPTTVLWHDGARLSAIDAELQKAELAPVGRGKGRNVWYCLGHLLATERVEVVALHDADIATYSRRLPARLLYPVAHPRFGYRFAKGYYYRTDGTTLNGRVTRLLVTPLLRALRRVLGPGEHQVHLERLAAYRYPLAGEVAMRRNVAAELAVPSDWSVEVDMLGEVHRRLAPRQVCQVDVAERYDHKHQPLSADDPTGGLHRMAIDITGALLRRLAQDGAVIDADILRTVAAAYEGEGLDLVETYGHDAEINGLAANRQTDVQMVAVFAAAVAAAGTAYLAEPGTSGRGAPWSQVFDAVPDIGARIVDAVDRDRRDLLGDG
ncbi:MAG: glycosyl transferase [Actinomycetota bacterium]